MSKTCSISSLAAGLGILAAACWLTTSTFPLSAAPQTDAPGVTVDMRGATVMHRAAVGYPLAAQRAGIEGTVVVEVNLNSSAEVADAHVLSGPEELRSAALESVLKWHFTRDAADSVRQVSIAFTLPKDRQPAAAAERSVRISGASFPGVSKPVTAIGPPSKLPRTLTFQHPVTRIDVAGLPNANRDELMARLPVHVGDTPNMESLQKLEDVVHEYDEHLTVSIATSADATLLRISVPEPAAQTVDTGAASGRIRVGGNVQQNKLVNKVMPVYPPDAKAAGVQGLVRFQAIIAKDGHIADLQTLEGDPMLVPAALEAVRQWTYQQTLLNGNPVEVVTLIDVNFTLAK